jgi:teichuronic acid biosynthesis glycosyltransferase TuaG
VRAYVYGPTVSIITPAYNAERYLAETVRAVLAQSFSDFELLIVDDGSTDGTLALARALAAQDHRVRIVTTDRNVGQAAARNDAMCQARGRFFALLDSDDAWTRDYLAEQLAMFRRFDDVDVVTANAINVGGPLDGTPFWRVTSGVERLTLLDILQREDSICIMSVFRRNVFDTIGGFDPKWRGNEDYHFWVRAALAGFRFVRNATPLGFYRRRPDSESADERRMLHGAIGVFGEIEMMCAGRPIERAAARQQIAAFRKRLMLWELRDAVRRNRLLNLLQPAPRSVLLRALRAISRVWLTPLLWASELRRRPRRA